MLKNILRLLNMIKEKDIYTYIHCINVAKYINNYCKFYNIDIESKNNLVYSALVHDIGKIFIDENILRKPGKLTNEEFTKIRKHTLFGYRFLKEQGINRDICMYTLYHHHRVDNNNMNYDFSTEIDPCDLLLNKDNANKYWYGICLLNLCDSYDAMTQRNYNKVKSIYEGIEEIQRCMNTQFEQRIAQKFIKYLKCNILEDDIKSAL